MRAGWKPVTHAYSSDERIHIERFSNASRKALFTLCDDANEPATTTVCINACELRLLRMQSPTQRLKEARELINGAKILWRIEDDALVARIKFESKATMMIEMR